MKRRALFVLAGSLVAVGVSAGSARASCNAVYTPQESMVPSLDGVDLAFVGTITERRTNPDEITFDVEDVWKGATPWTTTVRVGTDPDSSFGGIPGPLPGEKWLVFATEEGAFSSCGLGSQRWSGDLAQFRPADAHSRPLPPLSIFIFAVAICAAAGILTGALGSVNRRPRSTA